jgi:hypothetical protein
MRQDRSGSRTFVALPQAHIFSLGVIALPAQYMIYANRSVSSIKQQSCGSQILNITLVAQSIKSDDNP